MKTTPNLKQHLKDAKNDLQELDELCVTAKKYKYPCQWKIKQQLSPKNPEEYRTC